MNSLPQFFEPELVVEMPGFSQNQGEGEGVPADNTQKPSEIADGRRQIKLEEKSLEKEQMCLTNGFDVFEHPPPKTESEVCLG